MSSIFHSFCEMMESLPPSAAKKAAAVERRMLEQDVAMGREKRLGEVASVLAFCRFLERDDGDDAISFADVPPDHWAFYSKIVQKLVEAGELSSAAKDKFDGQLDRAFRQTAD